MSFSMAVQQNNYDHRGKGNYGIVVCCPTIVAPERLVYFDYNRQSGSWVIRDFITGHRLDNYHSTLTRQQVEDDAVHDEFPPWCSVEDKPDDWTTYLRLRTTAYLGRGADVPTQPPNPQSGTWELI